MEAQGLREIVSENYGIGDLRESRRIDRGYVNRSYEIETLKDGKPGRYFLRRYRRGIGEDEVRFEHSIISHLVKKNFTLAAGIIPTRDRRTYVKASETGEAVFYAVFEFLPGEDRYTWDRPGRLGFQRPGQFEELPSAGLKAHREPHDGIALRALPDGRELLPVVEARNLRLMPSSQER